MFIVVAAYIINCEANVCGKFVVAKVKKFKAIYFAIYIENIT